MKKNSNKTIATVSVLIAIAIVLKLMSIQLPTNRITFYNIPLFITGIMFGPLAGAIAGLVTDVSSVLYQPGWLPQYMITPILWGLIPGLFAKLVNVRKTSNILIIEIITHVIVSVTNTLILGLTLGFDVALGGVESNFKVALNLFNFEVVIIDIGKMIYTRLWIVFVVMLVKIPVDTYLIKTITNRLRTKEAIYG